MKDARRWVMEPKRRVRRFRTMVQLGAVSTGMVAACGCSSDSSESHTVSGSSQSSDAATTTVTTQGGIGTSSTSVGGASSIDNTVTSSIATTGAGGAGTTSAIMGSGQTSVGSTGMAVTTGTGGAVTASTTEGGAGGLVTTGSSGGQGGSGGSAPVCPKPQGEICHEFFVNDNSNHEVMYVNEFDPPKNWRQRTQDTANGNSPRQLEIVANSEATDGRAILVSVNSGYEEYDFVTHALLASVNLGDISVRGAQRLPDGSTVLGIGDAALRVVSPEGATIGAECSLPGSGTDTLRVLSRDPATGDIYFGRGVDIFAVTLGCQQRWTMTFSDSTSKAYRVLPRSGGGAWAATGYPASVVEVDAVGQVLNEVGGKAQFAGVLDFSSGFDIASSGNVVVANWWGHVVPPPQEGPHLVEFDATNQIVWRWGTQAEATEVTNVLVVR